MIIDKAIEKTPSPCLWVERGATAGLAVQRDPWIYIRWMGPNRQLGLPYGNSDIDQASYSCVSYTDLFRILLNPGFRFRPSSLDSSRSWTGKRAGVNGYEQPWSIFDSTYMPDEGI